MKQAKRILSLLLSLCLVLGLIPGTAFAAGGNLPFTDVNTTDWFYEAVQYAYEKGMMSGTSTTTFSPGGTTTRGMIVTILHRMEGTPTANGTAFTDVPADQWYSNAVSWASANRIVGGYGNGLFGPGDPITREQMAAILNRYSTYKGYDAGTVGSITGFSDASQVSSYAAEPMGWAIGNGLISGVGNNTLAPKGNATRAQVATILKRFCENIADKASETVGKTYTVTFDLNYGSDTRYDTKPVKEGETVSKPSNPSRSGYSFSGWYAEKTGGRQFDFKTGIMSDLTLYAHWSSNNNSGGGGSSSGGGGGYVPPSTTNYTVTFYMNDGTGAVHTTVTVSSGNRVAEPTPPERTGYLFDGWYANANLSRDYDFESAVNQNLSLYASWDAENLDSDVGDVDDDKDSVPALIESILGTSDSLDDSDGDGISDYIEIYEIGSDPSVADSDQDTDGDGISNYDEVVQYRTHAGKADTDIDGLNDYDELFVYNTNPLVADTDSDGIIDGDEVKLRTDPNSTTDILSVDQTLSADKIDEDLVSGNDAVPSLHGRANTVIDNSSSLQVSKNEAISSNRAVIGKGVETVIPDGTELTLTFSVDDPEENYAVMELNDETGWELVDSRTAGSSISADIDHSGTYCIVDIEILLTQLGVDIDSFYGSIMAESESLAPMSIVSGSPRLLSGPYGEAAENGSENTVDGIGTAEDNGENADDNNADAEDGSRKATDGGEAADKSGENAVDGTGTAEDNGGDVEGNNGNDAINGNEDTEDSNDNSSSGFVILDSNVSALVENGIAALTDGPMGQADIVFAIDTTGSMSDEISNVANNIITFAHTLSTVYNVNVNFALVDYKDIVEDSPDSTKVVVNGRSNWFTTTSSFRDAVAAMTVDGGGDTPETAIDALEVSRRLDFRGSAKKFIVLVTDADYKTDNNYGISTMSEEIQLLARDGIVTSVVTASSLKSTYQDLIDGTGGIFANIYGDFGNELLALADMIGGEVNEGNWILLNDYQYIALRNPLAADSGSTDNDGLSDWEELEAPVQKELTLLVRAWLQIKGVPSELVNEYFASNDGVYVTVYPYKSNPVLEDTDYDGIPDNVDPEPRDGKRTGTMRGYYDVKNARYTMDFRDFTKDLNTYSRRLASVSLAFANGIYGDGFDAADHDTSSIEKLLSYHGFDHVIDYSLKNGYNNGVISVSPYTDDDISEIGIGYHDVKYAGKTTRVVALIIRGTDGTIEEWSSNFDVGDPDSWNSNHHKGFYITEERIRSFIEDYEDAYGLDTGVDEVVYWVTGHSRGAALSNLLAAKLADSGKKVVAYTFATPSTTIDSNRGNAKYQSIFNFANTSDVIAYVPLSQWGFGRYGVTKEVSVEDSGLEGVWCSTTGQDKYNALNRSLITTAMNRINKSCAGSWAEVFDRAGKQRITDAQYACISERASRYCDVVYHNYWFSDDNYELYPSTAFVFQLVAELLAGSDAEKENVMTLVWELWNSKYTVVILAFVGDAFGDVKDLISNLPSNPMDLVGDGHAPATYYVLIP